MVRGDAPVASHDSEGPGVGEINAALAQVTDSRASQHLVALMVKPLPFPDVSWVAPVYLVAERTEEGGSAGQQLPPIPAPIVCVAAEFIEVAHDRGATIGGN